MNRWQAMAEIATALISKGHPYQAIIVVAILGLPITAVAGAAFALLR